MEKKDLLILTIMGEKQMLLLGDIHKVVSNMNILHHTA